MWKKTSVLMLMLLLLASCSKGKTTPTLAPFISGTALPAMNLVGTNFEQVDCDTMYGRQNSTDNQAPPNNNNSSNNQNSSRQCGYLTVPEDRHSPEGVKIQVAVTIYRTPSTERQVDPLLFINSSGGFGRGGFFNASGAFDDIAPDRDIIFVDYRGTGRSQPAYSCSGYPDFADTSSSGNLSLSQWESAFLDATQSCRSQLESSGVNLAAYSSTAIAADMEDLRQALGYSQWNIYANSYGTRVAFAMMRDYPSSLRSAILDSPWPLQVDAFTEQAANAEKTLDALFGYCQEDKNCNQYYPSVKDYFYQDIDALNANPLTLHVANLNSGALSDVTLDGNRLLDFVLSTTSSFQSTQLYEVPRLIYQLHDGKVDVITRLLGQYNGFSRPSGGITQLIQCNDQPVTAVPAQVTSSGEQVDPRLLKYFNTLAEANAQACEIMNPGTPESNPAEAVTSNVPSLLLSGELNWRIPASWATLAAQTLSHSYTVEFAGVGQAISSARGLSLCSNSIIKAFIDNPNIQPDSQCAQTKPNFIWITLP